MNHKLGRMLLLLLPAEVFLSSGLFYLVWNILMAGRFDQPRLGLAAIVAAMIPVVVIGTAVISSVLDAAMEDIRKREERLKDLSGRED